MVSEIVKYHNNLNEVQFGILNPSEMNIFFALCSKVKGKGDEKLVIPYETIRELGKYSATSNKRFTEEMEKMNDKILGLKFKMQSADGKQKTTFVPFPTFRTDEDSQILTVSVNEEFLYVLNDPEWFTRFELEEFTDLKGVYTKNLYRLLKQFRSTGFYKVNIDKFREILDVPKSYTMTNIDKRVLEPAIKEVSAIFPDLKLKKIKGGRGNKVKALEFSFSKESIPKHAKPIYSKVKKENLPDWVNNPASAVETPPTPEDKKQADDRIAKLKSSGKEA